MRYLDLTLPTAEQNLALDEALLEEAETLGRPCETLRLWEPLAPMVVVGRSSKVDLEVHQEVCAQLSIPILRRISGGAAVVTGPGCLMYSLVLSLQQRPSLHAVDEAHRFVLGTIAAALSPWVAGNPCCRGISDLVVGDRKFSGNSVRVRRGHLLYHGTLLIDFSLELIERCLAMPPRQPDYRDGRSHGGFVTNLGSDRTKLREALVTAFGAVEPCKEWPRNHVDELVQSRYRQSEWNLGQPRPGG